MAERIDNIGFGGLKLIQDSEEFCYGIDAVILADFASEHAKRKRKIADLGTGTGVIPLILSRKTDAEYIAGFEIQESQYEKAIRNASLNSLNDRISFFNTSVCEISKGDFDVVTCNPPYAKQGAAIVSKLNAKAMARHEISATLEDFISASSNLLKERGELFMVHRPSRLAEIFKCASSYHLEPKTMRMVSPHIDEAPNIVLLHFIKGAGSELTVLKPLAVYSAEGNYSEEILKIYEKA